MYTQKQTDSAVPRSDWTKLYLCVRATLLILSLTGSSDCASVHPGPASHVQQTAFEGRVLERSEIAGQEVRTAYDAIERLRPQYLRWTRGSEAGMAPLAVYVDHMRAGGIQQLRLIPAASVRKIRFLRAYEATFEYGAGNDAGAIDVVTGAPGW